MSWEISRFGNFLGRVHNLANIEFQIGLCPHPPQKSKRLSGKSPSDKWRLISLAQTNKPATATVACLFFSVTRHLRKEITQFNFNKTSKIYTVLLSKIPQKLENCHRKIIRKYLCSPFYGFFDCQTVKFRPIWSHCSLYSFVLVAFFISSRWKLHMHKCR
jgi:hypothetical protein